MKTETKITFQDNFEEEVYNGLTTSPKFLSSKYFYDKKGDKLFQDIMKLPEYYLTNCEMNIIERFKSIISEYFNDDNGFDLIELGAGDGKKTKILLREMIAKSFDFNFMPIDISQNVLEELNKSLRKEIPGIKVTPQQGTYFEVLDKLATYNKRKKVIMVLGSNIGNLLHPDAIKFLKQIQEGMSKKDLLFMGFDQKKNPQTILDAYNDTTGVTAAFNKNVLVRINTEMDANFEVDKFLHWEVYDPESGTAKSYLVSKEAQNVTIRSLNLTICFDPWETIHTEISQKYDDKVVHWLATESGLKVDHSFTDEKKYYKNYIFSKK
ncbi:L-histidine N(alpha)-methyltransferase [Ascidiimonas sp. W6]|uniref:L-histidine N(alpha)-methyltransferase n=1 Tax=Ascidiimonas meishanensis TaxID=3128903 RepID=UPI0030EE2E55